MRPAFAQGVNAGFDHIRGRIEIRLADLQMNDALALALQRARFVQNFKSGFSAQPRHAAGKMQFVLGGLRHDDKTPEQAKRHIIRPPAKAKTTKDTKVHEGRNFTSEEPFVILRALRG